MPCLHLAFLLFIYFLQTYSQCLWNVQLSVNVVRVCCYSTALSKEWECKYVHVGESFCVCVCVCVCVLLCVCVCRFFFCLFSLGPSLPFIHCFPIEHSPPLSLSLSLSLSPCSHPHRLSRSFLSLLSR